MKMWNFWDIHIPVFVGGAIHLLIAMSIAAAASVGGIFVIDVERVTGIALDVLLGTVITQLNQRQARKKIILGFGLLSLVAS